MKRIVLLAAGALGTAGMIALAAPASAQPSPLTDLGNSEVVKTFLYGNCGAKLASCPKKDPNSGVLNQFDFFQRDLKTQSKTFRESIDSFVKGIPAPPKTPAP